MPPHAEYLNFGSMTLRPPSSYLVEREGNVMHEPPLRPALGKRPELLQLLVLFRPRSVRGDDDLIDRPRGRVKRAKHPPTSSSMTINGPKRVNLRMTCTGRLTGDVESALRTGHGQRPVHGLVLARPKVGVCSYVFAHSQLCTCLHRIVADAPIAYGSLTQLYGLHSSHWSARNLAPSWVNWWT